MIQRTQQIENFIGIYDNYILPEDRKPNNINFGE